MQRNVTSVVGQIDFESLQIDANEEHQEQQAFPNLPITGGSTINMYLSSIGDFWSNCYFKWYTLNIEDR